MSRRRSRPGKSQAAGGRKANQPGVPMPRQFDRKTRQLCGQVAQTLNQVMWGECDDDLLRSLYVSSVEPAPDATRLLVTVQPQLAGETLDLAEVLERLAFFKGRLRSEVAASIHRKKTPDLIFSVVQTPPEDQEEPGAPQSEEPPEPDSGEPPP